MFLQPFTVSTYFLSPKHVHDFVAVRPSGSMNRIYNKPDTAVARAVVPLSPALDTCFLGRNSQTVGTPTVAVSTLVMAGSLAQVPTVAAAITAPQGDQGGAGRLYRRWRRFRLLVGLLHVVCRLVVVSERS